jgi:large subunit ribosomal protein L10
LKGGEILKTRAVKEKEVQEIKDKLSQAKVLVLTDYRGLDVPRINQLRNQLREQGGEYRVVKNTLTRIAVKELGCDALDKHLEGPTAIAFGYEDETALAKVLIKFGKENDALKVKAGLLEGVFISPEKIKSLSELPAREALLGQVLGAFQAPLYSLAGVLSANIRSLAYALKAVQELKEQEPAVS